MRKEKTKLMKKLEKLVKDYVRRRDNYTCQWCGKCVTGSNCHVSHVIPVSAGGAFRFDPLNMKVLCYHCHLNVWHKDPIGAQKWFSEKFPKRYEYLFDRSQNDRLKKWTDFELEEEIKKFANLI